MKERLRVVLLCSTCDGNDVGESWSSFQWAHGLSRYCDLTVLTYNRLGHQPASEQLDHARVVEWNDAPVLQRFERFSATAKPGWALHYWRAKNWIRKALLRGERFDLIHQVSPLALRHACPASGLGIPYIIGPLAGSLPTPTLFRNEAPRVSWYKHFRHFDSLRFRYDPLLRSGYRYSDMVIGVAPYVRTILSAIPLKRFELLAETGVFTLPDIGNTSVLPHRPLRLLYVGRIIRTKGLRDAIRSLGKLSNPCLVHLDVVGDGDDRLACEQESRSLGVDAHVTFHGKVPRDQLDQFYRNSHVFLFPSYREPSGNVIFESLSYGLPVVTSTRGGPGFVVDNTCGIRIEPTDPNQYSTDISTAIQSFLDYPINLSAMRLAARERVASMALWPNKIQWMLSKYNDVVSSRS